MVNSLLKKLVQEPKDDSFGYGIGKTFMLIIMFGIILYFLTIVYKPETTLINLAALVFSFMLTMGLYLAADYESKNENSKGVGFALFGGKIQLLLGIVVGLFGTLVLVIFLANVFCADPNYVKEGYCFTNAQGSQQFILPTQATFIKPELVEPFYSTILAPVTEELFFRAFLFYTLLVLLPSYFTFPINFKKLKETNPFVFFVLVNVIVGVGFSILHFSTALQNCPGEDQVGCVYRRVSVSILYNTIWTTMNQLTGGISAGLAGHIYNNFIGTTINIPNFILYIVLPIIILTYISSVITSLLKRR